MELAELGRALRRLGLRQPVLRAAFGTANAIRAAQLAVSGSRSKLIGQLSSSPTGRLFAMFVGNDRVAEDVARSQFGELFSPLQEHRLVEVRDGVAFAPQALLPHRGALVCAPWSALPDDSSIHLANVMPSGASDWLDIGTGSAFAPIVCGTGSVIATDIDDELLSCARLGIGLSDKREVVTARHGDLFDTAPSRRHRWVTFNAPIEGADALLARFWEQVPSYVEPGGTVVVHSLAEPGPRCAASLECLSGLLIRARYTPVDFHPSFAMSAWHPGVDGSHVERSFNLSPQHPHVSWDWISPGSFG